MDTPIANHSARALGPSAQRSRVRAPSGLAGRLLPGR